MTPLRIAINGFGRIGRAAFKIACTKRNVSVVAVNDLTDTETLANLLKYDTVYGRLSGTVGFRKNALLVNGKTIPVFAKREPSKLPWKALRVDVVLECTGRFTDNGSAAVHLKAGAKKVVVSAPTKGTPPIETFLLGVNEKKYKGEKVISNASCTTNCVAPVARVMVNAFSVRHASMTTIHSYTAEQNLVDGPTPPLHKDLRRARAAAQNIVPTTSGAAISTTEVLPELKGLFDGFAFRVPTICASVTDFTFLVSKPTTVEAVNRAFVRATKHRSYRGVLSVTREPLVSTDIIGDPHSAIVDLSLTNVIGGDLVKVVAWYDNEYGYACRLVEMASEICKKR